MNVIHQIKEAGFTLELLPNDKLGLKPSTLTQQRRDYLTVKALGVKMRQPWFQLKDLAKKTRNHCLLIQLYFVCRHEQSRHEHTCSV